MTDNHWTYGIDTSTKSIALAAVHPDGYTQLRTLTIAAKADEPARRGAIAFQATHHWIRSIAQRYPPLIVYIETPIGRHPNPELLAMYGIVRSAIWNALSDLYPNPVSVLALAVSEWRKHSIGHGNATKRQVMDWARSRGINPTSDDEADAFGIAIAGQTQTRINREEP